MLFPIIVLYVFLAQQAAAELATPRVGEATGVSPIITFFYNTKVKNLKTI